MAGTTPLERLDALINQLIAADQAGEELEPATVARELGEIRAVFLATPSVHRSDVDERHFRCESCGTITHGQVAPARCARCGKSRFVNADIESPRRT